ncbi:MAG: cyclase family protein [Armatimonadota bacterium]
MIYDISVMISENIPIYPGDPEISITAASSMAAGESSNVSILRLGSHTGTHVDPPRHMIQGGDTVENMPLDVLVGECFVCSLTDVNAIDNAVLSTAGIPDGIKRILFKTKNSAFWGDSEFHRDYTYLAPDGAEWLVSRSIQLVGIDYLSVEQFHSGHHGAHLALLNSKAVIIEGLDLSLVEQGIYQLVCLPLRILNGDGSPARAILIDQYSK